MALLRKEAKRNGGLKERRQKGLEVVSSGVQHKALFLYTHSEIAVFAHMPLVKKFLVQAFYNVLCMSSMFKLGSADMNVRLVNEI